ncbi:MAG: hypothetical protein ACR2JC_05410 [Chloroflexota bacterium]|nr:MAG: hypothetical protein DLM70_04165 [Chloroflexota bacterium]
MSKVHDSTHGRSVDKHVLRVYVAEHCGTCRESRRLAKVIAGRLKDVTVEVVDVDSQEPVDEIFAVPTFCYRGHIVSLGNPREDDLVTRVLSIEQVGEGASRLMDPQVSPRDVLQGTGPEDVGDASQPRRPRRKRGLAAACCGTLGLTGTLLCSLTMIAPALGLIATGRPQSSMGGMSHSGSVSVTRLPGWWTGVVHMGPGVVVASVLLLTLAVAARRRAFVPAVIVGGVILYVGMYVQPTLAGMYVAMVIASALLLYAYAASLRPTQIPWTLRPSR